MSARQSGFSLIEVLMATVLLGLLMAGAYAGIRTATRAADRGEALIDRTNKLRVAQQFLRRQLSQTLVLPFDLRAATGERFVFEGSRDELTFVSPMPGYLGHGGPYVQRLAFERGRDGTQLRFRHAMLNGFDMDQLREDEEREPVILLEHIREASFEFRAIADDGKLGDWRDDWEKPAQTPLMVRIKVTFDPDEHMNWPDLVIPLMLDPTAGSTSLEPSFFTGQ